MNLLSNEAKAAKNAYSRKWRKNHREIINAYQKKWRKQNPDKVQQYNNQYWERKATASDPVEEIVLRLHEQGKSLRAIALVVGINHVKVSRILKSM